jgi:ribosomal-protein-serine acetyltransferase
MGNRSPKFRGLRSGGLTLNLIEESDIVYVEDLIVRNQESDYFLGELHRSYVPRYEDGVRVKYGFLSELNGEPAGLSLMGVSSWKHRRGYTGADTFPNMRGRGVAPMSKPILFFLAFQMLELHRVETGCISSNLASRRSIEKTEGFVFEGTLRDFRRIGDDRYEDELRWAILRDDWRRLYSASEIEIIT